MESACVTADATADATARATADATVSCTIRELCLLGDLFLKGNSKVIKNRSTAISYYNKALEYDPTNPIALNCLGEMYLDDAIRAYRVFHADSAESKRNYEIALDYFNRAYASDPNVPTTLNNLGIMYCEGNAVDTNYAKAMEYFNRAIEIDPEHVDTLYSIGDMYYDGQGVDKNHDIAIQYYKKVIQINPKYAYAWRKLGRIYENNYSKSTGSWDVIDPPSAIDCYMRAHTLCPDDSYILECIGGLYDSRYGFRGVSHDDSISQHYYERSLVFDPNNINVLCKLGTVYMINDNYNKARSCFEKALEIDHQCVAALSGMGELIFHYSGYNAPSERYFDMVLEIEPDNAGALIYLSLLCMPIENGDTTYLIQKAEYTVRATMNDKSRLMYATEAIHKLIDNKYYENALAQSLNLNYVNGINKSLRYILDDEYTRMFAPSTVRAIADFTGRVSSVVRCIADTCRKRANIIKLQFEYVIGGAKFSECEANYIQLEAENMS